MHPHSFINEPRLNAGLRYCSVAITMRVGPQSKAQAVLGSRSLSRFRDIFATSRRYASGERLSYHCGGRNPHTRGSLGLRKSLGHCVFCCLASYWIVAVSLKAAPLWLARSLSALNRHNRTDVNPHCYDPRTRGCVLSGARTSGMIPTVSLGTLRRPDRSSRAAGTVLSYRDNSHGRGRESGVIPLYTVNKASRRLGLGIDSLPIRSARQYSSATERR
ncbi:hypothetical protein GYMLUDRAFT_821018 [Collybiopsis luxurians FD-317 M1]|uniref:Uncharacterized protein n=1 Tax=Collybiopsis luxurians FD-317 M1 TaxID=944289 RepID=A0A0D0BNA8_9AGAR|nr:hypothetical protein GYMLUDRAFT_821018 [Collybiopsis luxurians FD-317 M1]